MFKKHLYIVVILTFISQVGFAQKAQRLAYIDMAFVLENIPDYVKAQDQLDIKVKGWQKRLKRENNEIEALKKDFSNEKALLTLELIQEREDDIYYKELEYNQLQQAYFGPKGDLYLYRKLLVQPIQDKVYNAIQDIAVKKRYDLVFDKSSDLIMLYTNKRYDISDLVVNSIVRERKKEAAQKKRNKSKKKNIKKSNTKKPIIVKDVVTDIKEATVLSDSTSVKTITLKEEETITNKIEDADKILKDTPSKEVLERIEKRNDKRKIMLEKIRLAKEAKDKKKETSRKSAADKRAKRLKEINKHKEELNRKRDSAQQVKKDKKAKKDETKDN